MRSVLRAWRIDPQLAKRMNRELIASDSFASSTNGDPQSDERFRLSGSNHTADDVAAVDT